MSISTIIHAQTRQPTRVIGLTTQHGVRGLGLAMRWLGRCATCMALWAWPVVTPAAAILGVVGATECQTLRKQLEQAQRERYTYVRDVNGRSEQLDDKDKKKYLRELERKISKQCQSERR